MQHPPKICAVMEALNAASDKRLNGIPSIFSASRLVTSLAMGM
jgi:hypothetical protein